MEGGEKLALTLPLPPSLLTMADPRGKSDRVENRGRRRGGGGGRRRRRKLRLGRKWQRGPYNEQWWDFPWQVIRKRSKLTASGDIVAAV